MLPAWCSGYVGLPYLERGDTRAGLDCWGLVALVRLEVFGRAPLEYSGPRWTKGASAEEIGAAAVAYGARYLEVPLEQAREGDAILLRVRGAPLHIGLVVAPGFMLHVEQGCETVIEPYDGIHWRHRVVAVYRDACPDA